jgi:prophage regulatory protein
MTANSKQLRQKFDPLGHYAAIQRTPVRQNELAALDTLPATGYLKQPQIIGESAVTPEQAAHNKARGKGPRRPRPAVCGIFPVSSATWWRGIVQGRYPRPHRLAARSIGWKVEDIRRLLELHVGGTGK